MQKKTKDFAAEYIIKTASFIAVITIVFIFVFVFSKALPVIKTSGLSLITDTGFDSQISDAFYAPADEPMLKFGMAGLVVGTLLTTLLSLLTAGILSIGAAITICELTNKTVSAVITSIVRLLASIPSVIFGLIGLITVVPIIERLFITTDLQIAFLDFFQISGRSLLASIVVLSFMIVPTIISLSIDAIHAVPRIYKEAGVAFGMSHFRVIWKVILPSARSGIVAGMILGAGRGIGEAIAISMVCGGIGNIPELSHGFVFFLTPVLPLSSAIVNKSEAMSVMSVESALFTCGAILLLFGAALSVCARLIDRKLRKDAGYDD